MNMEIFRIPPENTYILTKLQNMRKELIGRGEERKAKTTEKIIKAIQRFPLPIISGRMAEDLIQGVGPQFSAKIQDYLKDKPSKRKSSEELTEPGKIRKIEIAPGSAVWVILMILHRAKSLTLSNTFKLFKLHIEPDYIVECPINTAIHIFKLQEAEMIVHVYDEYRLTQHGESVVEKLSLEVPDAICKRSFNPDSWLSEDPEEVIEDSQNFFDFSVVLQVDTAERLNNDFDAIKMRLENRGLVVEKCKLWVGDYQWVCKGITNLHLGIIVERKTADDLASSIVDGRYKSQKHKMKSTGIKCIYLLEGTKPSSNFKIPKDTLLNSLFDTLFMFDFQIRISKDNTDTLNWLARMTAGIQMMVNSWPAHRFRQLQTVDEFYRSSNPYYNSNIREVFGKQLRSIMNVGEQSTLAVLDKYPCPVLLYRDLNRIKGKRELSNFFKQFKTSSGQQIKKVLKQAIVELFINSK